MNANEISSAISPYLLRRLKSDVLDELPDLIEENVYIDLGTEQAKEYSDLYNTRLSIDGKDSAGLLALITQLKKLAKWNKNLVDLKFSENLFKEYENKKHRNK